MSYESLSWDSDFFGFRIGRVPYEHGFGSTLSHTAAVADADGTECLYLLCPIDDVNALHAALAAGFRPYDIRVELSRSLNDVKPLTLPVREAGPADESALERIASQRFGETRFFADPHFPRERCRELYVRWLRRGLTTAPSRRTLTVGEAEGFVVCRFDRAAGRGTIELFAVSSDEERHELGATLVRAAGREFAAAGLERAEVATQARNLSAQRLYQRDGYGTVSVATWLHRWRSDR